MRPLERFPFALDSGQLFLLMLPSFRLPPLQRWFGTTNPSREVGTRSEGLGMPNACATRTVAKSGPHPEKPIEPPAHDVRSLGHHHSVEGQSCLSTLGGNACAHVFWQPLSCGSAATRSSSINALHPTAATMPNSARRAPIALIELTPSQSFGCMALMLPAK